MGQVEKETHPYSYDPFAQLLKEVDTSFVKRVPQPVHTVVDVGCGTGAVIQHLFEEGKIEAPFTITGFDIDSDGLEKAEENLSRFRKEVQGDLQLKLQDAEEPWRTIPSSSWELVTCLNMIHLLDNPLNVFGEAYRLLQKDGSLLVSSAYEERSYPEGTERFWGTIVAQARKTLRKRGSTDIPSPKNLFRLSADNYGRLCAKAGFEDIRYDFYTKYLDRDLVRAICNFHDFANGALPGVPTEESTSALVDAVGPAFERFEKFFGEKGWPGVPRNWMFLTAKK